MTQLAVPIFPRFTALDAVGPYEVSCGIDIALRLGALLLDREAAQAAQLLIEYDPQPPFGSGASPRPIARRWRGPTNT